MPRRIAPDGSSRHYFDDLELSSNSLPSPSTPSVVRSRRKALTSCLSPIQPSTSCKGIKRKRHICDAERSGENQLQENQASYPGVFHCKDCMAPQPVPVQSGESRRTLRSHDGMGRFKSDLSTYFPEYHSIMNDNYKNEDLITHDTVIRIIDSPSPVKSCQPEIGVKKNSENKVNKRTETECIQNQDSDKLTNLKKCKWASIDVALLMYDSPPEVDPLDDSMYKLVHRKLERREKHLRNIEREKALHEKEHLERILEGLLSCDWTKLMGLSGIAEGEKKQWEDKRAYFIEKVSNLVDKFRSWKDDEKRLKLETKGDQGGLNGIAFDKSEMINGPKRIDLTITRSGRVKQQRILGEGKQFKLSVKGKETEREEPAPKIRIPNPRMFACPLSELFDQEFEIPTEFIKSDSILSNSRHHRRLRRQSPNKKPA